MRFRVVVNDGKEDVHSSIAAEREVHDVVAAATRAAYGHHRDSSGRLVDPPALAVAVTPIDD
jgi:hypothetical protein